MKKQIFITVLLIILILPAAAEADSVTVSSNNLDFSQPLSVLADPATSLQIGYDFNIYHDFIALDLRARTAQQAGTGTVTMNRGEGIAADKVTILPSLDAGFRIKLLQGFPFKPYLFSLLDYMIINSTTDFVNNLSTSNSAVFGLKTGVGTDILLSSQSPRWLFNLDSGYQYVPDVRSGISSLTMNSFFLSMGFGLGF